MNAVPFCWRPGLIAAALVMFAGSAPVQAQSGLIPPGNIGGDTVLVQSNPAAVAEANIRIERLEGELRALTGQMEQLMFQMRQMQDELQRAREDTEFRLQELEGGAAPARRSDLTTGTVSDDDLRQALLARERGEPSRDLGTLSVDGAGQTVGATLSTAPSDAPLDLSSLTLGGDPSARPTTPLEDQVASLDPGAALASGDIYDLGYDHVLRGDYTQAVATFDDFLARFPDDPLRPKAHFWLGESYFAMGDYTPAAEQFLTVFNGYPEDVKVPDALLKLGMSLQRLGAQDQACATFGKLLTDFPRAPQIVLGTAQAEQQAAGC
ncbi:MAG: tol-pal system protein YbgF [Devosiaceae bacterium]|nr:tol-pal system protein YbgF [Devosiaceae bacterium MH13]